MNAIIFEPLKKFFTPEFFKPYLEELDLLADKRSEWLDISIDNRSQELALNNANLISEKKSGAEEYQQLEKTLNLCSDHTDAVSEAKFNCLDISSLRVVDLKQELGKRNLPKNGLKAELIKRLKKAILLEEENRDKNQEIETKREELDLSSEEKLTEEAIEVHLDCKLQTDLNIKLQDVTEIQNGKELQLEKSAVNGKTSDAIIALNMKQPDKKEREESCQDLDNKQASVQIVDKKDSLNDDIVPILPSEVNSHVHHCSNNSFVPVNPFEKKRVVQQTHPNDCLINDIETVFPLEEMQTENDKEELLDCERPSPMKLHQKKSSNYEEIQNKTEANKEINVEEFYPNKIQKEENDKNLETLLLQKDITDARLNDNKIQEQESDDNLQTLRLQKDTSDACPNDNISITQVENQKISYDLNKEYIATESIQDSVLEEKIIVQFVSKDKTEDHMQKEKLEHVQVNKKISLELSLSPITIKPQDQVLEGKRQLINIEKIVKEVDQDKKKEETCTKQILLKSEDYESALLIQEEPCDKTYLDENIAHLNSLNMKDDVEGTLGSRTSKEIMGSSDISRSLDDENQGVFRHKVSCEELSKPSDLSRLSSPPSRNLNMSIISSPSLFSKKEDYGIRNALEKQADIVMIDPVKSFENGLNKITPDLIAASSFNSDCSIVPTTSDAVDNCSSVSPIVSSSAADMCNSVSPIVSSQNHLYQQFEAKPEIHEGNAFNVSHSMPEILETKCSFPVATLSAVLSPSRKLCLDTAASTELHPDDILTSSITSASIPNLSSFIKQDSSSNLPIFNSTSKLKSSLDIVSSTKRTNDSILDIEIQEEAKRMRIAAQKAAKKRLEESRAKLQEEQRNKAINPVVAKKPNNLVSGLHSFTSLLKIEPPTSVNPAAGKIRPQVNALKLAEKKRLEDQKKLDERQKKREALKRQHEQRKLAETNSLTENDSAVTNTTLQERKKYEAPFSKKRELVKIEGKLAEEKRRIEPEKAKNQFRRDDKIRREKELLLQNEKAKRKLEEVENKRKLDIRENREKGDSENKRTLKMTQIENQQHQNQHQQPLIYEEFKQKAVNTVPEDDKENYAISDAPSSSSESEEEETHKNIPIWARKENLLVAIKKQFEPPAIDPDTIFLERATCDLADIFSTRSTKFIKRNSTGNWLPDFCTLHDKQVYKREMGYK